MPAPLDLGGDEYRAHVKALATARKRRQRSRDAGAASRDGHATKSSLGGSVAAGHVTPPLPPASLAPDPTPSTPPKAPPQRGNVRVAALIDALRAEGMTAKITGTLTDKDRRALLATQADPVEVAALYGAIYRGEYGDDFMHRKLCVAQCVGWLPGWLSHRAGHRAPDRWEDRRNGHGPKSSVSRVLEVIGDDLGLRGVGGPAGVGGGQAGGRFPGQLPG